jgi:hypothetical protein
MVPTLTCGFVLRNFSLAMVVTSLIAYEHFHQSEKTSPEKEELSLLEPTTGIEPVNLILTKDVLYQLSYVGTA